MATVLAVLATDAPVPHATLQGIVGRVVQNSWNAIAVNDDTSTNDTFLLLANGAAGGPAITAGGGVSPAERPAMAAEVDALEAHIGELATEMAKLIIRDSEGSTKFVTVTVEVRASPPTPPADPPSPP